MDMTYTALAKSLGISLKSVSTSSAASPSMDVCSTTTATTSTIIVPSETGKAEGKTEERLYSVSSAEMHTKEQGLERDLNGHISGGGNGPDGNGDADSDMDAEGISDSDIASSRPPTPTSISPGSQAMLETNPSEGLIHERTAQRGSLTDDELHYAKILVLDLLGWGVSPEYLLCRGISHALLYTIFMDLRLRLPDPILADCIKLDNHDFE